MCLCYHYIQADPLSLTGSFFSVLQGLLEAVQTVKRVVQRQETRGKRNFTLDTWCDWVELVVPATDAPGNMPNCILLHQVKACSDLDQLVLI